MVKIMIDLNVNLNKSIKKMMIDEELTNKSKAILKILEEKFGGKRK